MSRGMSPAASLRSSAASRRSRGIASPASMRPSQSAPTLKGQLDAMGAMAQSHVLGTMAQGMGAKIASTLHHRGEHEVGAVVDPTGNHVYVPRAQWTQSHDHPLKPNNAQWNQQHFVADELKRLHGEAKKKEYYTREVDYQLKERSDHRTRMVNEKQAYAKLVNDDSERHKQDQEAKKAENQKGLDLMKAGLNQQQADLSRRAHENRLREAQDAAEIKMRTVQQMCEELAEQDRKKKQASRDCQEGMADNQARRLQAHRDKHKDDEKSRREIREALMQDEYREQAKQARVAEKQDEMAACTKMYERTAGLANRNRESAELTRLDNDEKKHLIRTDAFFAQRERARERQRVSMVGELDRQMAAVNQKRDTNRLAQQADREAIQAATRKTLDAELAKASAKKAEEMQLQQELRIQMLEKEEREAKEGGSKPLAVSTMNMSMRKNGSAYHNISDLHKSMDASKFLGKPCGKEDRRGESRYQPLDASPGVIRKMIRETPMPSNMMGPGGSALGGVVGTLGGGGGPVQVALMATGGPHLPLNIGIAIQDRKLASHWHEGIEVRDQKAGREAARRREAAKSEANHD